MQYFSSFTLASTLCLLALLGCMHADDEVTVTLDKTAFVGLTSVADGVDSFRGIPFAKPPIGPLRWKPPQSWVSNQDTFSAKSFASACIQTPHIVDWYRGVISGFGGDPSSFPAPEMSEDCLYLNIWRPSNSSKANLPVIVYIHGGSNKGGWSFEPNYFGHNLAKKDVIVVGISYRLGVFGFFSHPLLHETNFGLSDQVMALEWIQEHIQNFGGDPANVTIMGESLGADHVAYLLASPLGEGLFSRAILQSGGSSMTNGVIRPEHLRRGELFSQQTFGEDREDVIDLLRKMPAREILQQSKSAYEDHYFESVIDGNVVTSTLIDAVRITKIHNVDLLIGTNDDEWLMYLDNEVDVDGWLSDSVSNQESQKLKSLVNGVSDPRRQMDLLITANLFVCPSLFLADKISSQNGKTWVYSFTRTRVGKLAASMGSYHGAELPYVFGTHDDWLPTTDDDLDLSEIMQNYWINFARSGDPNSPNGNEDLPFWPAYTAETKLVQVLDTNIDNGPHTSSGLCEILTPERYASSAVNELDE